MADHKVGEIKRGLLLFLGVAQADEEADLRWLLKKVLGIRLFPDEEGRMNEPLGDEDGILVISQFTLFGSLRKGFRPSFNRAAEPGKARSLYEQFDGLKKECKGPVCRVIRGRNADRCGRRRPRHHLVGLAQKDY